MIKRLTRSRLAILLVAIGVGVPACYIGAGMALFYWKEHAPQLEAGAVGDLEALSTMEANNKSEKGVYSANFLELGVPLGASANANQLTWRGGYVFEFSNVTRDASGKVTDFWIIGRPEVYKWGSKRNYLMDSAGNIYATSENRPATIRDRKLNLGP